MQTGDFDFARLNCLEDARQQAHPYTVTEFGALEAEGADLAQHGEAVGVAVGVPAGGKGVQSAGLHVRVARAEHGGKAGRFLFAPPALARLFKMPVAANDLQRAFAINFLFEFSQSLVNGLAFSKLYFSQIYLSFQQNLDATNSDGWRS
jgi:hypothetical protein